MRTSLEPSNVTSSPYIYLTFFLTHHEFKGPHIVVSDGREFGEEGNILVGKYDDEDYEVIDRDSVESFTDLQSALVRVKELADGH